MITSLFSYRINSMKMLPAKTGRSSLTKSLTAIKRLRLSFRNSQVTLCCLTASSRKLSCLKAAVLTVKAFSSTSFLPSSRVSDRMVMATSLRLNPQNGLKISDSCLSEILGSISRLKLKGEVLEDSYKHKDAIPFRTRSKLMMACNFFPTVNDTSDGFMRR